MPSGCDTQAAVRLATDAGDPGRPRSVLAVHEAGPILAYAAYGVPIGWVSVRARSGGVARARSDPGVTGMQALTIRVAGLVAEDVAEL